MILYYFLLIFSTNPINNTNLPINNCTDLSCKNNSNILNGSTFDYKCLNNATNKMCSPGIPNQSFKENVAWNLKTFNNFLESNPTANGQFNKIINNYGILKPESGPVGNITGGYGLALPDPNHLVETVEEALAIQYSFREYVRTLLESMKKYLSRSSIILSETVKDIKSKYQQLKNAFERYKKETSPNFKDTLSKHIIDLKRETEEAIMTFEDVLDWQQKVTKNMAASL